MKAYTFAAVACTFLTSAKVGLPLTPVHAQLDCGCHIAASATVDVLVPEESHSSNLDLYDQLLIFQSLITANCPNDENDCSLTVEEQAQA